MLRTISVAAMALLVSASLAPAVAQSAAPAKEKISRVKLKEMRANWNKNKPKLAACRKEMRAKGLAGDDRWFFISDCMGKS